ncbi:MAG TPA: hypothetical protein VIK71_03070 [Flavobacteriales bacterium]
MKKILLFTAFAALAVTQSFAQLSTRENYDVNLRMGTRPQAGDAALQFVLPMFGTGSAGLFSGNSLLSNDFLTYKYYYTNDIVLRGGLRWSVESGAAKGTAADSSETNQIGKGNIQELNEKYVNRDFSLGIGAEKHFTNSNIFDVYAGAEVMFGFAKDKTRNEYDYFNGNKNYVTETTKSRVLGFGLFTGFNMFVAELPLSVGLEYGLTGKWLFGGKTKVEFDQQFGSVSNSGEYFAVDGHMNNEGGVRQYSDFKSREFNMNTNHNVRLSINIYFSTLANPRNAQ